MESPKSTDTKTSKQWTNQLGLHREQGNDRPSSREQDISQQGRCVYSYIMCAFQLNIVIHNGRWPFRLSDFAFPESFQRGRPILPKGEYQSGGICLTELFLQQLNRNLKWRFGTPDKDFFVRQRPISYTDDDRLERETKKVEG